MKWNQTSPDLWQSICCICMRSMLGPGSCSSSFSRSQSRSRPPEQCRTSPTSGPPWASHTFLYAIILPETHMQIIETDFILYNNKFRMTKKCFWCYKKKLFHEGNIKILVQPWVQMFPCYLLLRSQDFHSFAFSYI